jgi:hypothetical protein
VPVLEELDMKIPLTRLAALALCAGASVAVSAATTVLDVDFEDDEVGPLGPPWAVFPENGGSSVSVVDVAGQPTACTGVETGLGPPFDGVMVMDASNPGWGGRTQFDNILVRAR